MKITKQHLKKLIKEELEMMTVLDEDTSLGTGSPSEFEELREDVRTLAAALFTLQTRLDDADIP